MKTSNKSQSRCPVPNGKLMIIGGAENKLNSHELKKGKKLEIHREFLKLIGKKNPIIAVVTTASEDEVEDIVEAYKTTFEEICPCTVYQIHHEKMADIKEGELEKQIAKTDALFFTGGDQLRLTSIYGGSLFLFHAKNRYIYHEMIVGGTSAGAMALSTPMIFAGNGDDEMTAAEVKITTGFEFLKDVCIDTHFVERGRFVRMAQVIATNPACIGIGIEEDTAMIVNKGIDTTICGHGVVIIIDAKKHTENNITTFNSSKKLHIRGLNVDILSGGHEFKLPQVNPPHI